MKNWLTPLLLVLSLGLFCSCSNTSEIIATGLKIELTKVERQGDGTLRVTWQVSNPNVVSYLIDRSVHKVTLDGVEVGTITDEKRLGVAAQSRADRTDTLAVSAENAARLTGKASTSYRLVSTVSLLIYDDDKVKATLEASGTVPVVAQ